MWDNTDRNHYMHCNNNNIGQICNDEFSQEISKYALNLKYKTFLEVGTWNGLGSTKVFVDSLKCRTDNYIFYSIECNKDKAQYASELYKNFDKVHILNEVLWNEEPKDFYDIFPQCKYNDLFKLWNDVDMINMKNCNIFLHRNELPNIFDVILLDGGEFTTYYDFQLIKNRCKVLMLDDINVDKCKFIVNEIENNPNKWKIIVKNTYLRNGFLIAERC